MNMRMVSPRGAWAVSLFLAGIGLAGSGYLLGRVFLGLATPGSPAHDLCSAWFHASCDGALLDRRFWILRVPPAGWGLVYFTALGGLLFLARYLPRAFGAEALVAAAVLNLAGIGAGLALSVGAWLGRASLCPLCLTIHAVSLLLLITLRRANPLSVRAQARLLRDAWEWLLRSRGGSPDAARGKLVGFGGVALLAVVAYQWVYVEVALRSPPVARAPDRAQVIAAFRAAPRLALPVSEEDPHLGPIGAPVQLVVFESFRCPSCRRFAATLSELRNRFRDRLTVVYKHYPLSTTCNERLTRDMQPGACEIAWAAEAARRQASFWPFYDALFAAGADASEEGITAAVRRLNLDPARFAADRWSDSARARVAADIALGGRLEIPGTPTVYLDGRLVPSPSREILQILIRSELDDRPTGSQRHGRAITDLGRTGQAGRPSEGG